MLKKNCSLKITLILSLLVLTTHGNYVINGDFESPVISDQTSEVENSVTSLDNWSGYYYVAGSLFPGGIGLGQYLHTMFIGIITI